MNRAAQALPVTTVRPQLYNPPFPEQNVARWRINGYAASIVIWTRDEWERLPERPTDAQYYPCGVWCALRMDD
jgi:hypothetical protein